MILVRARINNLDADTECDDSKFEIPHFVIPYQQSGSPNQQNGSPLQQNGSQNQQVLNPLQQKGSSRNDKGGRANYMMQTLHTLHTLQTMQTKMTGGTPEVRSDKSLTLGKGAK